MKKKLLSLFLCICMLLSSEVFVFPVVSAEPTTTPDEPTLPAHAVYIQKDGIGIADITLKQYEKETLTAAFDGTAESYQWQILADEQTNTWVNIYDKTSEKCDVSYALVRALLDSENCAYLRCVVKGEDNISYYSGSVCVVIEPETEDPDNVTSFEKPDYVQTGEEATPSPTIPAGSLSRSGDDTEYVYIYVKYLDEASSTPGNDHSIYTDYIAQIEKGTPFKNNVASPGFLGFAPYYDANGDGIVEEDAKTIPFNLDAVNEDITIRVYYRAVNVPFAVRYYFQNINDDFYTEQSDLYWVGSALTGTIIEEKTLKDPAAAKSVGLAMMYHIPEAVAADGSTVFECYYDRLYSLLQFDNNGGYGVDPIYARYGAAFVVNDPVKHGYVFAGWDEIPYTKDGEGNITLGTPDGVADELPTTIPTTNKYYKALWTRVNTTYTVVYWKENANDNGYSYWGYAEKSALSASNVSATDTAAADNMKDAPYFTFNPTISDKDVFVEGDGSTVVNAYYTRNRYTITFKASGLCTLEANHVHGDSCYEYRCSGKLHVHDANCTITCGKEAHKHTDACCTLGHTHTADCCSIEPHTHNDGCCAIDPHTHGVGCYTATVLKPAATQTGNAQTAYERLIDNLLDGTSPISGNVYRCRANSSFTFNPTYYNFFYFGNTWYYLGTGNDYDNISVSINDPGRNDHTTAPAQINTSICSSQEHIHGDGNCTCATPEHDHTSGCNSEKCGKVAHNHDSGCDCTTPLHTHVDACYDCGVEVHTHVDACKLLVCAQPTNHTHGTNCNNASRTNTVKLVTRKYEQNLDDIWSRTNANGDYEYGVVDDNGKLYDDGQRWKPSDTDVYGTQVLVYIATMPGDDFTLTVDTGSSSKKTISYYLEVLPGEDYDVTYNGKNYEHHMTISVNLGYFLKKEDFFNINGYDQETSNPTFPSSGQMSSSVTHVDLYYSRTTTHVIEFKNYDTVLSDKEATGYMVGASLSHLNFTPDYPNLEPNAYYFDGWYSSPGCFPGTEVNWSTLTQPDDNLMLYAKWSPMDHSVKFFTTLDDLKAYEENPTPDLTHEVHNDISHGNTVGSVKKPTLTGSGDTPLIFSGWFYLENGVKKAFDPLNMPVKKDINVFADWSSNSPQPYRIHYVLKTDPSTKVADDSFGYAYAGSTRTFMAKTGNPSNQLYAEYANGYFPTIASHSITMEFEEDQANPVHNVFTFEYVFATNISYTVRYLDKQTNLPVHAPKSDTTNSSVITERFETVANMIPDAFYKRLVISVVEDPTNPGHYIGSPENVITFYYTPNTESAYYAVHFMMQKLNADGTVGDPTKYETDGSGGYLSSGSHIEGIADINAKITINPQIFAGFNVVEDHAIVKVGTTESTATKNGDGFEITIKAEGTELFIFYQRKQVNYTVHYYENGTTNSLVPSKTVVGSYFGSTQTENALELAGYTCISDKTKSITIQENENVNVIIFYYTLKEYVAQYVRVPDDGGTLSQTIEVIMGNADPLGSKPTANKNYEFVGWFLDEACTIPVTAEHGTLDSDNKFTPNKEKMNANGEGDNIYYAKFRLLAGNLTIVRQGAADENQMFVYKVTNGTDITIWVTIMGNGSTTIYNLPFGNYTITQENDWSWRYGDPPQIDFNHNGTAEAKFNYNLQYNGWLSGNSYIGKSEAGGT